MKKKIKYTKEPTGELKVIKDFLPPPDQLVVKEENVKVTIAFKKSSVDFFSFLFACFVGNTKVWFCVYDLRIDKRKNGFTGLLPCS